jgi:hypothetical protein
MPDKCPICFSDIGTPSPNDFIWTDDPIFSTPAPSIINNITDPPSLITYEQYLGFTRIKAQHIKELQDNRRQIETDLGLTHTVFSPIDTDNFFQNMETYVYELRTSTENILSAIGMTKEEYFNYDKDGNDMRPGNHQLDWTDIPFPVYNLRQYQSKSAHIEDLRHFIQLLWLEKYTVTPEQTFYETIQSILISEVPSILTNHPFIGDKGNWRIFESLLFTRNLDDGIVDYTHSAKAILDDTELSRKIQIKANIIGTLTTHISGGTGATLAIAPSLNYIDNIDFDFIDRTYCSFEGLTNIIQSGSASSFGSRINITIEFDDSTYITYTYGFGINSIIPDYTLTLSEINNFNRSLYNDYINKGYSFSEGLKILHISFNINSVMVLNFPSNLSHSITNEFTVDNIKFYQQSV